MTPKEMQAAIEAMDKVLKGTVPAVIQLQAVSQEQAVRIEELGAMCGEMRTDIQDAIKSLMAQVAGFAERVDELTAHRAAHDAVLEALTAKVEGRNRSAPTKRNMTDADALEVMTGKYRELDHKTAAEQAGLTYAQVYSARGEFTFKHVHKELRETGWKNPWSKDAGSKKG